MQKRLVELETIVGRQDEGEEIRTSRQHSTSSTSTAGSPGNSNSATVRASVAERTMHHNEGRMSSPSPLLGLLREMSIGALGEYMGATSQITMSRIMASMIGPCYEYKAEIGRDGTDSSYESGIWKTLTPKSASSHPSNNPVSIELNQIPSHIASKLLECYLIHISTRWPVMHTPYIKQLHDTRKNLTDVYEITALHLVYAIGGRFLETAGETGEFHSDRHCEKAIANLDEIIQRHAGLRSIQILILLSLYNLRSPRGPGAWTFTGLAMRKCIEMGLHRQTRMKWPLIEEVRRRVFWTCYCLDRQVSIILGRPFSISDRDIDAELPTDIDENIEEEDALRKLQQDARGKPVQAPQASTSMTGFLYLCRLRIIESEIQQTIYRVDKAPPNMREDVETFIQRLEQWKSDLPLDARTLPDFGTMRVDGYDNYMAYYYKCMRFLLYPVILSPDIADVQYLKKCAEACAGVCRTYKKLHQAVPVGFSVMALHAIFISGLTLLYCIWAAPGEVFSVATSNGLDACSNLMYVIAERWVGARKYRDVFDVIRQAVMDSIEMGANEPRRTISNLRRQVENALRSAGSSERDCRGEFSEMVNGMTVDRDADRDTLLVDVDDQACAEQVMAMGAPPVEEPGFDFMSPIEGMPLLDGMVFGFPSATGSSTTNMGYNSWDYGEHGHYSKSI